MKRTPFFKSKLPWFNFLAFPPAAAEPQGCCSLNKRQLPGPVSGAGASWVFSPSSPLPSVHPTPVGRWWGGKPCSTTPQLQHEESEDRRGLSPELCAPVWRGPHKWGCVLLAGHHQTWERAASQRHFCPWISKPSARFRKRLSDVPPKRKKEVLKGGIWGEEVTHGLKERWAGSDSQPRQQKRSPTVPSRGNGDEEGAWGSRASGTATVLHSPPGRRIFNASHPLPPPPSQLLGLPACLAVPCMWGWKWLQLSPHPAELRWVLWGADHRGEGTAPLAQQPCLPQLRGHSIARPSAPATAAALPGTAQRGGRAAAIWVKNKRFLSLFYTLQIAVFKAVRANTGWVL